MGRRSVSQSSLLSGGAAPTTSWRISLSLLLYTLVTIAMTIASSSLLSLLTFASVLPSAEAFVGCDSYAASCRMAFGAPLQIDAQLPRRGSLYFKTTVPSEASNVAVSLSMHFGDLDVYMSQGREPTTSSHDCRSADSRDFINCAGTFHTGDEMYILVTATSPSAIISLGAFSTASIYPLLLGVPTRDEVAANGQRAFSFTLASKGTYTVSLTAFTRSDPNLELISPDGSRRWTSDERGGDTITFVPETRDVNSDTPYTVLVKANNTSSFSVVLNKDGVSTMATTLLGGFPQYAFINASKEKYYTLLVPPGLSDVVISVETIYGDADLFVNPFEKGFHMHSMWDGATDEQATWRSEHAFGSETVFISSDDASMQTQGGKYLITVFGFEASGFIVRGYSADSAIVAVEGEPVRDLISAHAYHYFKFYDNHPDEDVIINVSPVSGDPDIFVGCDLSITGNETGFPSRLSGHYAFTSQRMGADTITVPTSAANRCAKGVYYIAIYAFSRAEYSLTAKHAGGAVVLSDGIQVTGSLYITTGQVYSFRVGPQPEELTIKLTSMVGDADLFVSVHSVATYSSHEYQSLNSGTDEGIDTIVIPEEEMCTNCWVSIYVYGFSSCAYSLVAHLEDTTLQLSDGVPMMEAVADDSIQYYAFTPMSDGNVSVVLSVFSGLPVIYLSNSEEKPGPTTPNTVFNMNAKYGSTPVATIGVASVDGGVPGPVYVGIGGNGTNATFTVRAALYTQDHATGVVRAPMLRLIQGIAQQDSMSPLVRSLDAAGWKYYQVVMPAGHQSLSVRANSLIGQIDLYVSKCPFTNFQCAGGHGSQSYLPSESSNIASTAGRATDFLDITRSDAEISSYIIGVYTPSMYAEYVVSFTMEDSTLRLQPGIAVSEGVAKNSFAYFSFQMPSKRQSMRISLMPISGDPDLYVSTTTTRPKMDNFTWRSLSFGTDTLTINPFEDSKACVDCIYYIGVYGFLEASFSIIVALSDAKVRLVDGRPVTDRVQRLETNYYSFTNTYYSTRSLKVVMSSMNGDADLYVTMDGTMPSRENFQYISNAWGDVDDVIVMSPQDPQFVDCLEDDCVITIAVYGYENTEYSLSLSSNQTATRLRLAMPQIGSVRYNSYDYYDFPTGTLTNADGIRVSVNQFSGRLTVYMACSYKYPTASHYEKTFTPSMTGSFDVILSTFNQCNNDATVSVGVYAHIASTYSISIVETHQGQSDATNSLLLLPGIGVTGNVGYQHFDYYYLKVGHLMGDLELRASAQSGDVDLYVSESWEHKPVWVNDAVKNFRFKSSAIGAEDLVIDHDDIMSICRNIDSCYLIVGVLGAQNNRVNSEYSLVYTTGTTIATLKNGVAVRGHVDRGYGQYYMFSVGNTAVDVVISVTPFYGDPDVFISLRPNTYPSIENYTWMEAFWGSDTVTIQAEELTAKCSLVTAPGDSCDLFIGVSGYTNTSYSIVAISDEGFSSPVILVDGQAQSGSVDRGEYSYFKFDISMSREQSQLATAITFTLTQTSNGDTDMYIILRPNGGQPGKANSDYRTMNGVGQVDEVRITAGMPFFCTHCTAYIAVYGFSEGSFSITATTDNLMGLISGLAVGGTVDADSFRYYSLYNPNSLADIIISLSAETGDPDIYVTTYSPPSEADEGGGSLQLSMPTRSVYRWRALQTGNDDLRITTDDLYYCYNCYYIIGIYASISRNSTYRLLVTADEASIVNLISGRTLTVNHGDGLRSFRIVEVSSTEDLTISFSKLSAGSIVVYLQAYNASSYRGEYPDPNVPSSYAMKSRGDDLHFYVPHNRFLRDQDDELVYVMTVSSPDQSTKYSVVASSVSSIIDLIDGQPQNHVVNKGYTAHFRYYMSNPVDLRISLTAKEGDPDLLASMDYPSPGCVSYVNSILLCGNYTWRSASASNDQIIISKDAPCTAVVDNTEVIPSCNDDTSFGSGVLYIGVYGYQFSRFTLVVSALGKHVNLVAGIPQQSATALGYLCSARSPVTGKCLESASVSKTKAYAAYFGFRLAPSPDAKSINDAIVISIRPSCSDDSSYLYDGACTPGCSCNPLQVFVKSCIASRCTEADKFPSGYSGESIGGIDSVNALGGSSVVLRFADYVNSRNKLCDPEEAGEPCMYYVSVVNVAYSSRGGSAVDGSAQFSITMRRQGDMSLVPCGGTKSTPDGIRQIQSQLVHGRDFFEICNPGGVSVSESTTITLEPCYGSNVMYACSGSDAACAGMLPNENAWGSFADTTQTCVNNPKSTRSGIKCSPNELKTPSITLRDGGNYFVLVNGTGNFVMRVKDTMDGGQEMAPLMQQSGEVDAMQSPTVVGVRSRQATLTWPVSTVTFPDGNEAISSPLIRYSVYAIEKDTFSTVDNKLISYTQCGLQNAVTMYPTRGKLMQVPRVSNDDIRHGYVVHTLTNLAPKKSYLFFVVAYCDAQCLRDIGKTVRGASTMCSDGASCQTEALVYPGISGTTLDASEDSDSSWFGTIMSVAYGAMITLLVLCSIAMAGAGGYYLYMKHQDGTLKFDFNRDAFSGNKALDFVRSAQFRGASVQRTGSGDVDLDESSSMLRAEDGDSSSMLGGKGGKSKSVAMTSMGYAPPSFDTAPTSSSSSSSNSGSSSGSFLSATTSSSARAKSQYSRIMEGDLDDDDITEASL